MIVSCTTILGVYSRMVVSCTTLGALFSLLRCGVSVWVSGLLKFGGSWILVDDNVKHFLLF